MRTFSRGLAIAIALTWTTVAVPQEDEVSSFTKALKAILAFYAELVDISAAAQEGLEKELLAKRLLTLSFGFNQLEREKRELTESIRKAADVGGEFDPDDILAKAGEIETTIDCVGKNLTDVAVRMRAQDKFDGAKIEDDLRNGLAIKAQTIRDIADGFGLPVTGTEALEALEADSAKAEALARTLQKESLSFAKKLDESLAIPSEPPACTVPENSG